MSSSRELDTMAKMDWRRAARRLPSQSIDDDQHDAAAKWLREHERQVGSGIEWSAWRRFKRVDGSQDAASVTCWPGINGRVAAWPTVKRAAR